MPTTQMCHTQIKYVLTLNDSIHQDLSPETEIKNRISDFGDNAV